MTRRPVNARDAAEAVFKPAAGKPERVREASAVPGVREAVTLRVEQEVLEHFQADGPGWQERMVEALRAAAGKVPDRR